MGALIRFEFLKLYKKKMNLIVFWGTCIAMAALSFVSVIQTTAVDEHGDTVKWSGYAAYMEKQGEELGGTLTGERVKETIAEYQEELSNPDNIGEDGSLEGEAYYKHFLSKFDYMLMVSHNYDEPGIFSLGSNLAELNPDEGLRFYERRNEKLNQILDEGSSDWTYSEAEKQFWLKKNEKIGTPFVYGYHEGWGRILDLENGMTIPLLALCVLTAAVYAGEYEKKTDHIILTTKYGKSKVIAAKNIAAFLYGALFFVLNFAVMCIVILGFYGVGGWNLPIQIWYAEIPYPFTYLQAVLVQAGVIFAIAFGLLAITLFLSSRMKSTLPVLTVMLVVIFAAMFIPASKTNGILNHVLYLLPWKAMDHGFMEIISYRFGKVVFDFNIMRYVVYLLFGTGLLPFAGKAFKKHQVQ